MRIVRGEGFVKGKSHCMSCSHELSAADLVPVFSYLVHRGRCRYCGEKISVRYPASELGFMLLAVGLYVAVMCFGFGCDEGIVGVNPQGQILSADFFIGTGFTVTRIITFFKYLFLTGCLYVVSLTDLESFEIPDGALIIGAIGWAVFTAIELFFGIHNIKWALHHLLAGFVVGAAMLLISVLMDKVLRRDSLGGGDIKLFSLLGLYLGYAGSYELIMLSCILGLVFAGVRRALRKGASKEFPFGPSIALAGYILLIFGDKLTNWYLGFFK